jgi:hypothetical protein
MFVHHVAQKQPSGEEYALPSENSTTTRGASKGHLPAERPSGGDDGEVEEA